MSNVSIRIKQDKAELRKQKVTVARIVVATEKFLFGTCDCRVDSEFGTGDFFARAEDFAHVWTRACAIARVSGHGLSLYDRHLHFYNIHRNI